jgi:hypothetical protein
MSILQFIGRFATPLGAAAAMLLAVPSAGGDPPPRRELVYKPYPLSPWNQPPVGLLRGDCLLGLGTLNGGGDFCITTYLIELVNKPRRPQEPVYRFVSDTLVKGTLRADGSFVPDVGGAVTAFKDYRPGKEIPRIYNLPGRFIPPPKEDVKEAGPGWKFRAFDTTVDPNALLIAALERADGLQNAPLNVALLRQDGRASIGHFDPRGEFIEFQLLWRPQTNNWQPSPVEIINRARRPNEPVFEYRNRLLIPGTLRDNGDFVPDKGAAVSRFEDYHYSETAPRIYNLPGRFNFAPPKLHEKQIGTGKK